MLFNVTASVLAVTAVLMHIAFVLSLHVFVFPREEFSLLICVPGNHDSIAVKLGVTLIWAGVPSALSKGQSIEVLIILWFLNKQCSSGTLILVPHSIKPDPAQTPQKVPFTWKKPVYVTV